MSSPDPEVREVLDEYRKAAEREKVDSASASSGGVPDAQATAKEHPCKLPDETYEHDWTHRWDWDGDPNVINGTRTWKTVVCRWCGVEQQELDE
jgi:hypothetical protein